MRSTILKHIQDNVRSLGSFKLSQQLPFTDNEPVYLHNMKHIYVDTPNTQQNPMFDAFDQAGTVEETTTVSVYFANDAKKLPAEYETVAAVITSARTAPGTEGYFQRLVQVVNTYQVDVLITHATFTFKRLLTN